MHKCDNAVSLLSVTVAFLFCCTLKSYSQDSTSISRINFTDTLPASKKRIDGSVSDNNGIPLRNISVYLKEKKIATITDENGRFSLPADSNETVIITAGGFKSVSLKAKENYISREGLQVTSRWAVTDKNQIVTKEKAINVFPIPFPSPSASYDLPLAYFARSQNLGQADRLLSQGLSTFGYDEKRYYHVNEGFALVTRMEQTDDQGYSLSNANRWSAQVNSELNSPWNYIKALFSAPIGYYRVLVFLVTPADLQTSGQRISAEQARQWFSGGYLSLPMAIRNIPFTAGHRITLLVYQYRKEAGSDAAFLQPGSINGKEHFERSKISTVIK